MCFVAADGIIRGCKCNSLRLVDVNTKPHKLEENTPGPSALDFAKSALVREGPSVRTIPSVSSN